MVTYERLLYHGMRGGPVTDLVKQVPGRCPLSGAEAVNVHPQRELDDTGQGLAPGPAMLLLFHNLLLGRLRLGCWKPRVLPDGIFSHYYYNFQVICFYQ